jgi:hypothetical protein
MCFGDQPRYDTPTAYLDTYLQPLFYQVIAIIVVLAIFSSRPSPTMSGVDEWTACERPLGVWLCIWIARVTLVSALAYWGWVSDKAKYVHFSCSVIHVLR